MTATGYNQMMIRELNDKEFRDAFVVEHVRTGIAYQIAALRNQRGWSQAELGERSGDKRQNSISRLENPDSNLPRVQTLLELAAAFDVALLVRFVPYSELLERTADVSPKALQVPSFPDDKIAISAHSGAKTQNVRIDAHRDIKAANVVGVGTKLDFMRTAGEKAKGFWLSKPSVSAITQELAPEYLARGATLQSSKIMVVGQ